MLLVDDDTVVIIVFQIIELRDSSVKNWLFIFNLI